MPSAPPQTPGDTSPPIPSLLRLVNFIFHDVLEDEFTISGFSGPGADWYKLSLANFEALLDTISANSRYPLEHLAESASIPPPSNATLLTFDDGGASCFDPIAGTLESRGLRARFFVVTARLGQPGFLSVGQCRELAARGHIVGSHSESHPAVFSGLPKQIQVNEWRNSRIMLEQLIGSDITSASVPGGNFSRTVAASAAEAGYKLLFTSEPVTRVSRGPEGLLVAGRVMLTKASHAPEVAALARCSASAMSKRWLLWNGRKVLKRSLRPLYDRIRLRIIERQGPETRNPPKR